MKKFYSLFLLGLSALPGIQAQVVTTSPAIVQQSMGNIVIIYHADRGNKGLMGIKPPTKVYAHTGVITNLSEGPSDWKYAPTWGTNTPKYEMKWETTNTWTLTIPSIDSYYGVSAGEIVEKLAFVFRTANGSAEGKTESGGDIFVDVLPPGFQIQLTSSAASSVVDGSPVKFTVNSTNPSQLSIYLNSVSSTPLAQASSATSLDATYTFTQAGSYEIIAVAKTASESRSASIKITRLGSPIAKEFPGGIPKMGYTLGDNGDVTFCVAAPGKSSMVIVPSWDNYDVLDTNMMFYHDYNGTRYFWITKSGLNPDEYYPYYYLVDGERKVGDPYARLVLDPWNDKYIPSSVFPDMPVYPIDKVQNVPLAVYKGNIDAYDWQVNNFQRGPQSELIIYELLIRDFSGTEGKANGEGTIAGVIDKLDYLSQLGVNAIELLPIMEFNGNNSWGYNTNFYFAPDKAYGTPDDYKRLIDECHRRGLAVILDIVFNQSDGLHPWYQMYEIAKNPFYNGSAPHSYSVLNDWNQDNPLVQQQWRDCLDYWLTAYKVDGFRFDLVKGLGNNDSYGNTYYPATNTWGPPSEANTNRFNATRVARMKALHDAMRKVAPDAYFINENLAGAQEENDMAKDGETNWANVNYASCQFAMGYSSGCDMNRFYAPLDSRTWGSTVSYAESHDEERMAYKQNISGAAGIKGNLEVSMRRLGSVAAQMLLTPGAHMIWQFQEFGADQTTKNSSGNDTSPKKVIWSYLDNEYRAGLHQSYVELCNLRKYNQRMFKEGVSTTVNFAASNWVAGRTLKLVDGQSEIYLIVNPMPSTTRNLTPGFTKPASAYRLISSSYNFEPVISGSSVSMIPGSYAVFATADISGVDEIKSDATEHSKNLVYGGEGIIVIEGEYENVNVYTVDGRTVGSLTVPAGLYIVNVDGATTKVLVH